MEPGLICQSCGIEAPTKYVEFYQNIGALVMRYSKSTKGNLCKKCIHKHYWSMTGTTAVLGWWGSISAIITPFLLLNNTGRYLFAMGLPSVPPGARVPVVTNDVAARIYPHLDTIFARLNNNEDLRALSRSFAPVCGVTPGEVLVYVVSIIEQSSNQPPPITQQIPGGPGFPVVPTQPQQPPPLPRRPMP